MVRGIPLLPLPNKESQCLSGILNSEKAIDVNIAIMRAFVLVRQYALSDKELSVRLNELESKYNQQSKDVYDAINFLLQRDKKI